MALMEGADDLDQVAVSVTVGVCVTALGGVKDCTPFGAGSRDWEYQVQRHADQILNEPR